MKYIIILIGATVIMAACNSNKVSDKKEEGLKTASPLFKYSTLQKMGVNTSIKLPSQLTAYQEVSIFPKVNGYVKTVLVDIGQKVRKGNVLMILEAPEMEQAVLQAKEKYLRAKSDLTIDKEHFERLKEASHTEGTVSPFALSTIRAKVASDSALLNAEKLNWQMQQTMMDYLSVTAPFDGVITERNVHPGALVNSTLKDKPMLELKQFDHLRLGIDVPEAMAGQLKAGDSIFFFTSAFPGKKMAGILSRKSDNVNLQFRTERIEADIKNVGGILTAGMYADVVLKSKGNMQAFAVEKSAIVTTTERKYIILIRDKKTFKVDITTGNENTEWVEVLGEIVVGEKYIVNASDDIKEGKEIE